MSDVLSNLLWVEKYRPRKIADCVLPEGTLAYFQKMVAENRLENMTLVGSPGTGKTTVARALCEEMGVDYILINASENGNIDTIRNQVRQFASTISFKGGMKCIILDESDYITTNAQAALRSSIEEFSASCRFILTANFPSRIIPAILSRCPVVEFNFHDSRKELSIKFAKRCMAILEENNIQYDKKDLALVVKHHYPDFRKILGMLQRHSNNESMDLNVGSGGAGLDDVVLSELFGFLKEKEFSKMRKWVAENMNNDDALLRRSIYNVCEERLEPDSIPQMILLLAEYDYKAAFVVDKEINMVAFLTNVMTDVSFK